MAYLITNLSITSYNINFFTICIRNINDYNIITWVSIFLSLIFSEDKIRRAVNQTELLGRGLNLATAVPYQSIPKGRLLYTEVIINVGGVGPRVLETDIRQTFRIKNRTRRGWSGFVADKRNLNQLLTVVFTASNVPCSFLQRIDMWTPIDL